MKNGQKILIVLLASSALFGQDRSVQSSAKFITSYTLGSGLNQYTFPVDTTQGFTLFASSAPVTMEAHLYGPTGTEILPVLTGEPARGNSDYIWQTSTSIPGIYTLAANGNVPVLGKNNDPIYLFNHLTFQLYLADSQTQLVAVPWQLVVPLGGKIYFSYFVVDNDQLMPISEYLLGAVCTPANGSMVVANGAASNDPQHINSFECDATTTGDWYITVFAKGRNSAGYNFIRSENLTVNVSANVPSIRLGSAGPIQSTLGIKSIPYTMGITTSQSNVATILLTLATSSGATQTIRNDLQLTNGVQNLTLQIGGLQLLPLLQQATTNTNQVVSVYLTRVTITYSGDAYPCLDLPMSPTYIGGYTLKEIQ